MSRTKLNFKNEQGDELAALLETPTHTTNAYAIFAHCFTCSKDIAAASRVSRALTSKGIAVLRFDFTGLGNSDGDFANTNFSSNLQDLISASKFLSQHYQPPSLLIGHSLGGAAVLAAAHQIDSIKAIVTIAAPATAVHVEHLFAHAKDEISDNDEAEVQLGLRKFTIKKQFLEDIANYNSVDHIGKLNRPLLIFHSPIDDLVSIDEAAKIYQAARHPKSFISLENADHLLSRKEDSEYVATVMASWVSRYLDLGGSEPEQSPESIPELKHGQVLVIERDKKFLQDIYTDKHRQISG